MPKIVALLLSVVALCLSGCKGDGVLGHKPPDQGDDGEIAIGETGGMCGGIAGFQCQLERDYCEMTPGECRRVSDSAGLCAPKPEACTREYRPVCGCDEITYSNACVAAAAGVSIAAEGACDAK